ncbi:hypothetical protein ACJX0J_006941, partial [Zea mays]
QPKRHLLTTGWSVFVSAKRLVAGDYVLFIWNDKNQLLLGIRHASRPQTVMPSSVLSSDSMHIGLLAAAAHAAATNSRFTIFFNPKASKTEFVIPLSKYIKAVFHTRISVGMRFRMLFETEESSVRSHVDEGDQGVNATQLLHNEPVLVTVSGDGSVGMWDVTLGQPCVRHIVAHTRRANAVVVALNDKYLCTGGSDQKVACLREIHASILRKHLHRLEHPGAVEPDVESEKEVDNKLEDEMHEDE